MSKTVLITGASRGIGWETALSFAVEYKYKVIVVSRNAQQLQSLAAAATSANGQILPFSYDLMKEDMKPVADFLTSNNIHSIDILINNAGYLVNKPFSEINYSDLLKSYTVNTFSPFLLIQQLLPFLKNSKNPHVVNISSMGGFQGASKFSGLSVYSSAKAAIACITECLAEELKDINIKINCLCLGSVETEMLAEAFPGYTAPVSAKEMAIYITRFADTAHRVMNGKIIPLALKTP